MAYDTEIMEQAKKAINLPKYDAFDDILLSGDAESMFGEKFNNEREFVDAIIPQIKPMIESVYGVKVNSVYREYWFRYRKSGYFDFRADVVVETDNTMFVIEAKNPTHTLRESLYGISQLMMYDIVLSKFEKDCKLIYLSSIHEPMVTDFIKKHNLDIDLFLWNGKQTAHWDNSLS